METADRTSTTPAWARRSLLSHKAMPQYRTQLVAKIQQRETPTMTAREKRWLRLERMAAKIELDKFDRGEKLSEFTGLISLRDPLAGLYNGIE
jgi:hypothetical protein